MRSGGGGASLARVQVGTNVHFADAGDCDGDQLHDLAIVSDLAFPWLGGVFLTLRSLPSGRSHWVQPIDSWPRGSPIVLSVTNVGDRDGDGVAELLVAHTSSMDWSGGIATRTGNYSSRAIGFLALHSGATGAPLASARLLDLPDGFGYCAATITDVDGDGRSDYAHRAYRRSVDVRSGATGALLSILHTSDTTSSFGDAMAAQRQPSGAVHLAIGDPDHSGSLGRVQIYDVGTATVVATAAGTRAPESFGATLAALGDVDKDGIGDWAVGSPLRSASTKIEVGRVHVCRGTDLAVLHIRDGATGDRRGSSLAMMPDWNGDGINDVLAGSPGAGPADEGELSVINGKNGLMLATWSGAAPGARLGTACATCDDANGDGHPDVLALAGSQNRLELRDGLTGARLSSWNDAELGTTSFTVAPPPLWGLHGATPGPLVALGSDRTDTARLLKLDDLYRVLRPDHASDGDTVRIEVNGGAALGATSLVRELIDGVPDGTILATGTFDTQRLWSTSITVPPGMAGITWTLRGYGLGHAGATVDTGAFELVFE